ncbi:MAG: FecCD family ABC transporter permease [Selenomonas artemidis]|uniref:FecCD family ABC transporter permease n=1 Tax=Selenomonas sp. FOBRC9 TaxID=936573 RepID=UPI001E6216E3|nr:iron ABC transporter permease [Selenomonas sp. FOBRC9]
MMGGTLRTLSLAAALILVTVYALGRGTIPLGFTETIQYIWLSVADPAGAGSIRQDVIACLRLPQFALSFLIGAGLAAAGAVMQAVMKNPLADPYLLGISSGASLGAVLAIVAGIGTLWGLDGTGLFAFFGAVAVSAFILLIASLTKASGGSLTLLLAGFATNAACSAALSFVIAAMAEPSKTRSIQFWMMGSLGTVRPALLAVLALVMAAGVLYFISQRRVLDLMLMGDELSLSMGRDLALYRKIYIAVTAVMVGSAVYAAGMIGFVGLIVPHAVRLVTGSAHRYIIPLSALGGGAFLAWANIIGRNIVPGTELPIGVTTTLAGAPLFLWMLFRRKYGGGRG